MATGSAGPAVRIVRRASFSDDNYPSPLSFTLTISLLNNRKDSYEVTTPVITVLLVFFLPFSLRISACSQQWGGSLWVDNGSPCFHFTRSQKWPQTASLSLTHTSNSLRAFDHIHNKTQANVSPLPLMRLSWLRVHQRTSVWLSTHTHTHKHPLKSLVAIPTSHFMVVVS